MKYLNLFPIVLMIAFGSSLLAQNSITEVKMRKGEVLDVLLLSPKADFETLFADYKETVFPIAAKLSYQSVTAFGIPETLQGNIQSRNFVLGRWDNLASKERFLATVLDHVPDFHERRKKIWSTFQMAYFELEEDLNLRIDRSKYNVITALWQKDGKSFANRNQSWKRQLKKSGGRQLLELRGAHSPVLYWYQPDLIILTEWKDKAAYEAFLMEAPKLEDKSVKYINEFSIQ